MTELKSLCEQVLKDVRLATQTGLYDQMLFDENFRYTAVTSAERLAKAVMVLSEACEFFCENYGYDHPSLIHENAGHPIPRALAKANEIASGE